MIRFLSLVLVTAALTLGGRAQVGDRAQVDKSAPPAHWKLPSAKVLTVEESMASFQVPAGFRLELVAAEPLVQDPVLIQFDERGRLWVIEWPAYNWPLRKVLPGFDLAAPPNGRLVILEDTDGDGRMDKRTVVMDHPDWVRGLVLVREGAVALRLPNILFARASGGGFALDQEEVVVSGLEVPVNVHGAQSNLMFGMDNWIYGSKFGQRLRWRGGKWLQEPNVNLRGQWGMSQDNYGRPFYASNGDHLRADLVPSHYFARNPNYNQPAGIDVQLAEDQSTWPPAGTPGSNRRLQLRDTDGSLQVFTANTAPSVYRGDQFPAEYVGNVFLGEVAGRFLRRSIVTEKDGELAAANAYEKREFMFSPEERFRPVYTTNGPDGALYIADMHRGVIEGDIFMTSYLRNQVEERRLQHPFNGLGRIYRLVHTGRPARSPAVIARADTVEWVKRLAHPNGFWRDTAQRILIEQADSKSVAAIQALALEHGSDVARLHAWWTLEGLGALTPGLAERALRDASPKVRVAGLRLVEPFLAQPGIAAAVLKLSDDAAFEVRRQLVFTLGEGKGETYYEALLNLVRKDGARSVVVEAAVSGLRGREWATIERVLGDPRWATGEAPGDRFLSALAQAVVNSENVAEIEALLMRVARSEPSRQRTALAMLDGLVTHPKKLIRMPDALATLVKSEQGEIAGRAAKLQVAWAGAAASRSELELNSAEAQRGKALYPICGACHGPEGKGTAGLAPPLATSAIVANSVDDLIKGILLGRNLDRSNKAYPDMPSFAGLPDADVAAIATYVRAQWGPSSRPVPAARIRQLRQEFGAPAGPEPTSPR